MHNNNAFSHTLLKWFSQNGRDLPWRRTKDPYAIWLSEVILQQTRINQGTNYWHRFLERFPTVESLAKANEDDVLRLWQGLGYYSRARNLHTAARQIAQLGHFPNTTEELRHLKGVGDYIASAVGSIAFDLPVATVDGNVYRVLSRYFGIETPINSTKGKREFASLAQDLLPTNQASAYNQALMDFGSLQCTPKSPLCPSCPLQETCIAFRTGKTGFLPIKSKKTKVKERQLSYVYIRFQQKTAIHKRSEGDIWQGLWEPLLCENTKIPSFDGRLMLLKSHVRHVLTHRVIHADFYLLDAFSLPALPPDYIWIDEKDINLYAVPRLIEKLLSALPETEDIQQSGKRHV